jgi:serine/threonine protein kinase
MDYYPGGDLFNLLSSRGILSEDEARFYVAEIIMALDYLHEEGVIYRDLKVPAAKPA